jgi:hypothetical protein
MVQYLGDYWVEVDKKKTFNIILEYGELDLVSICQYLSRVSEVIKRGADILCAHKDEFFADDHSYSPILTAEIIDFWRSFFKVAEALEGLHYLKHTNADGFTREYDGYKNSSSSKSPH